MRLVQTLKPGPIDIVGDIHGEYDALEKLLRHLGYDDIGGHPDGRYLVFVGDFCDRGPNSPAVISLIRRLVRSNKAMAVLGNHEINIIRCDPKDGSGWFFEERYERDSLKYSPFERVDQEAKFEILEFLNELPIALERDDIRVIHAAWIDNKIECVRNFQNDDLDAAYSIWDRAAKIRAEKYIQAMKAEASAWGHGLDLLSFEPPNFPAHGAYTSTMQMGNPIKVLTAGVERPGKFPFYSNGRWRFAERVQWWNEYYDDIPVVIGHYWRKFQAASQNKSERLDPDLFENYSPASWHGARGNVFCVDYSIGGKFVSRNDGHENPNDFRLAALRWPENTLHFDNGEVLSTSNFRVLEV